MQFHHFLVIFIDSAQLPVYFFDVIVHFGLLHQVLLLLARGVA